MHLICVSVPLVCVLSRCLCSDVPRRIYQHELLLCHYCSHNHKRLTTHTFTLLLPLLLLLLLLVLLQVVKNANQQAH
jgi:hypothetical protein